MISQFFTRVGVVVRPRAKKFGGFVRFAISFDIDYHGSRFMDRFLGDGDVTTKLAWPPFFKQPFGVTRVFVSCVDHDLEQARLETISRARG
jgi:hypothetical protein